MHPRALFSQVVLPPIPAKRYFTIGEVSELCAVKPHVLRYWEQEFTQLRPMKRRGNRRYYQHHEVLLVRRIRELLYEQGFTINGARNRLAEGARRGRAAEAGAARAPVDEAAEPGLSTGAPGAGAGGGQPPSTNGQLLSTDGQPPSTNGQPLSTDGQPLSTDGQPLSTDGQPPSTDGQPPLAGGQAAHGRPVDGGVGTGAGMGGKARSLGLPNRAGAAHDDAGADTDLLNQTARAGTDGGRNAPDLAGQPHEPCARAVLDPATLAALRVDLLGALELLGAARQSA